MIASRRRGWQFSLKTALIATLTLSVLLAVKANRADRQRRAVEAIRQLGGTVIYDYQLSSRTLNLRGRPAQVAAIDVERRPAASWLRDALGDDWFDEVRYVTVRGSVMISGATFARGIRPGLDPSQPPLLAQLATLRTLERLSMTDHIVNDESMAHLGALPRLKVLDLSFNQFGDRGLAHIAGLSELEHLDLSYVPVTDDGLVHLKSLQSLSVLDLSGTEVTDKGLVHLEGLRRLSELHLSNTGVSESGVARLNRRLPDLRVHDD